jgi:outer membrane protein OmpA-like peptidoglycan-associated protein
MSSGGSTQMNRNKTLILIFIFLMASTSFANVVGTDAQNFNTSTDGLDFLTVNSSETLKPGIINFGLFFNYAANTLPYFEANPQDHSSFNDTLLANDLNFGIGLMNNWDAGISFPSVITQSVQNTSAAGGQFSQFGTTEIRPNTKVRFFGNDSYGLAVVASMNFNRIQNNPYSGIGGGPSYNLEIAGDDTFGPFAVALNVGHRWRNPGTQIPGIPVQPIQNQIIYSAAANYLIPHSDTKGIFEIFGGQPTDSSVNAIARTQSSLEAILGIKHDFTDKLAFQAGAGTGINNAIASPSWRVYTGLNYTIGPVWHNEQESHIEHVVDTKIVVTQEVIPLPVQEKFVAHNILFEFNSDVLTGDYEKTLAELELFLHHPTEFKKLTIEGNTDSVGSETYNMALSIRRAAAIRKYLIEHFHLDASKIQSFGFGPTQPIADNGNYQGRQLNRRVDFKIDR